RHRPPVRLEHALDGLDQVVRDQHLAPARSAPALALGVGHGALADRRPAAPADRGVRAHFAGSLWMGPSPSEVRPTPCHTHERAIFSPARPRAVFQRPPSYSLTSLRSRLTMGKASITLSPRVIGLTLS